MVGWNKKRMVEWYDMYAQDEGISDDEIVSVLSVRYKFIAKDIKRLISLLGICDDDIVLDAGYGAGRFIYRIQKTKNCRIYGVDTSRKMIQRAKKRVPDANYLMADVLHLPFKDRAFSAVICYSVLWHIPPEKGGLFFNSDVYENGLREFKRVLMIGGKVLFNICNPFHPHSIVEFFSSIINVKFFKRAGLLTYKMHLSLSKTILTKLGFRIYGIVSSGYYPITLETLCHLFNKSPSESMIYSYYISFSRMEHSFIGRFLRNFAHSFVIKAIKEG